MPSGYSPLPNPRTHPDEDEMEAAFEASDDEDDTDIRTAERRPLNPERRDTQEDKETTATLNGHRRTTSAAVPAAYDFENVDYDFPPPGSPPRPDRALPNNSWGNSNGIVPSGPALRPVSAFSRRRDGFSWISRVLPSSVSQRLNKNYENGSRVVVGSRDGVFANVTAKPTVANQIRPGELTSNMLCIIAFS